MKASATRWLLMSGAGVLEQVVEFFLGFGVAFAGCGGEKDASLVAIFRDTVAGAVEFGEREFGGHVALFHGGPKKVDGRGDFRADAAVAAGAKKLLRLLEFDLSGFRRGFGGWLGAVLLIGGNECGRSGSLGGGLR